MLVYILVWTINVRGLGMKVALTVWKNWISPVFDAANMFLVAEIQDGEIIDRHYESFDPERPSLLVNRLIEAGVSVFICGAISEIPAFAIENSSIKLIPFVSGRYDDVLYHYIRGRHVTSQFFMPGCRCNSGKQRDGKRFSCTTRRYNKK